MLNDQLETFTDRAEAQALFDLLRGRDARNPWPLLPILAFIAPGGSGKSTLIEYLKVTRCCLPGSGEHAALPYASLDFTQADAPKDLLPILVSLRNQLQQHRDGESKHLSFPRFDLGASIVLATTVDGALPDLKQEQVQQDLSKSSSAFGSLSEMGNALGGFVPFIPPLLVGVKWAMQVPALHTLLQRLENDSGWRWYRSALGLAQVNLNEVLLYLHSSSIPGKPGKHSRNFLVEQLLPAALVADLLDALDSPQPARAWSKEANVVLFLDGFEALLSNTDAAGVRLNTGIRLLEGLTAPYKRGETGPLLLVLGSRQRLLDVTDIEQNPAFDHLTMQQQQNTMQQQMHTLHSHWQQRLPSNRRVLRLKDICLPLWLHDFGLDDTRSYLTSFGEKGQTQAFSAAALVQAIHRATHGHPLCLALAAAAVLEAEAHSNTLDPATFEKTTVSPDIVRGYEAEAIEDYLLSLFLRQLSEAERRDFIFCAAPRSLDVATLKAVLQLPTDVEAKQRWDHYRQLTFVRTVAGKIVLHPVVRDLLLHKLSPSNDPTSDYQRTHSRLRTHFQQQAALHTSTTPAQAASGQSQIEAAYHTLALGDAEPALALALTAQCANLTLWNPLLEAVAQAPTELIPPDTKQQAFDALSRAKQHHYAQDGVTAIILYIWLLAGGTGGRREAASMQMSLGTAYQNLPGGDRQENIERAIASYQAALEVYTREAFPFEWARTQMNLGIAYQNLPGGDRQRNIERAIAYYQAALEVRTRETFPVEWAGTQVNLGLAYQNLPGGDRQRNIEQAIASYQAALEVRTREAFPFDWARTQMNLGTAYSDLPGGERQQNIEGAIACYQAALEVRTREAFPDGWARTHMNLGTAYRDLPGGDHYAHVEQAMVCYRAALQVHTPDAFPADWAEIQHNLGLAYASLSGPDQQRHLEQAITCYEDALRVYRTLHMEHDAEGVGRDLEEAQLALQELRKEEETEAGGGGVL